MAEVLLTLEIEPDDAVPALTAALERRRWSAVPSLRGTLTCYFDAAIPEQVERIVLDDVRQAAAEAGARRWRGACSIAAIPTAIVSSAEAPGSLAEPAPCAVWMDGATPVGPLGEVVLTIEPASAALAHELSMRGWVRLAELPCTFMHPFDLGMFAPIDAIVRGELGIATRRAGIEAWRGAWALATWGHLVVSAPETAPPGPHAGWRL